MLARESVSIITVGKYNKISTPRVLMLENSPCDIDSGCLWHGYLSVLEQGRRRRRRWSCWCGRHRQPDRQSGRYTRDGQQQLRGVSDRTSQLSDRAGAAWASAILLDVCRPRAWRGTRMSYLPNGHQFRVKSVLKWLNCAAVWTVLTWLNCLTNGTELFLHMAYRPIVHW